MTSFADFPDSHSYKGISEQSFRLNLKTKEEVEVSNMILKFQFKHVFLL